MSHVPAPDILELAELHLAITPLPARIIWENTGRMWTKQTIKAALAHLAVTGRAQRSSDAMPCGTPRTLYRRAENYDARKDLAGSIDVGFAAIRDRVAAGGEGWNPKAAE